MNSAPATTPAAPTKTKRPATTSGSSKRSASPSPSPRQPDRQPQPLITGPRHTPERPVITCRVRCRALAGVIFRSDQVCVSCGGQPGCDVLVEGVVEFAPGGGEGCSAGELGGQLRAERCEPGGEYPAVGLGERDGDRAAVGCEPVAVGAGQPLDDLFAA